MASLSGDRWLIVYDSCERLSRDILEKIDEKNRLARQGKSYTSVTTAIRPLLKKLNDDLSQLRQSLVQHVASGQITSREGDRRQLMFDNLSSKAAQIESTYSGRIRDIEGPQRSSLLGDDFGQSSSTVMASPLSWNDDVEGQDLTSVQDTVQQQKRVLREQDEGLEALSSVISRQKQIAYTIGDEADLQNELLDDINDHVDRTRERILKETRHVNIVTRKSGTCGLWLVILLLLVAIIVIVAVPGK